LVKQCACHSLIRQEKKSLPSRRTSSQGSAFEAQDEALHLAEVAANIRAVRNCQLYRLAAREIEKSFAEARTRMSTAPG
jgi:hypothetical protein